MSRLSTKNYKPRATGSLRHLMLKVFCAVLKTAPYRLNYSNYIIYDFTLVYTDTDTDLSLDQGLAIIYKVPPKNSTEYSISLLM